MAKPALRAIAVAGALATGFLFGGVTVPAGADPGDPDASSQGPSDSDGPDDSGGSGDADSPSQNEPEDSGTDEGGSGIVDDPEPEVNTRETAPTDGETSGGGGTEGSGGDAPAGSSPAEPPKKTGYSNSFTIPMFRLPAAGEIPAGSWPTLSTFYTTVEVRVPTFQEFLASLGGVPTPAPSPGPAFRTQEEAPVVDASTGTVSGGGGGGGGGTAMSDQQVLQAPLVTVPRSVTVAGGGARTTASVPAGPAAPPGVTQPGAAGAQAPVLRGSLPPTPGVVSVPEATPMSTQGTRAGIGYPRYVRTPTVTELAAVALPGVAGLLVLTFGGGFIGYRQANSARFVRTAGAERFLA